MAILTADIIIAVKYVYYLVPYTFLLFSALFENALANYLLGVWFAIDNLLEYSLAPTYFNDTANLVLLYTGLIGIIPNVLADAATLMVIHLLPDSLSNEKNAFMFTIGSYVPLVLTAFSYVCSMLPYFIYQVNEINTLGES